MQLQNSKAIELSESSDVFRMINRSKREQLFVTVLILGTQDPILSRITPKSDQADERRITVP